MTLRRGTCSRPSGWHCSGDEGHAGPCASWPDPSYEEIEHVYEFGLVVATILVLELLGVGFFLGLAVGAHAF